MLFYHPATKRFIWAGRFEDRDRPRAAGFTWSESDKLWFTGSPYIAYPLRDQAANEEAKAILERVQLNILSSQQADNLLVSREIPAPAGRRYLPYQEAGIDHLLRQYRAGRKSLMLADEQGLGKTIQAIGVANALGMKNLLVVCPAALKENWARELERWHMHSKGLSIVRNRKGANDHHSAVVSYNLADEVKDHRPDLVIIDESSYIKHPLANRTQTILGNAKQGWRGLVFWAPSLLLTGTPIPNRSFEFWAPLYRCAPDVIDHLKQWPFAERFCILDADNKIRGSKREEELYTRLRGSGFMVRRLKRDVLKDLPPKAYRMVTFAPTGEQKLILKRERAFDAKEILHHGVPFGSALPEIRQEMGIAKVPQVCEYTVGLLDEGAPKVVVFAYHREVLARLEKKLAKHHPVVVMGGVGNKQDRVDRFQEDPNCRILLGQLTAAGTGFTMTASADVVFAEASWVPGENDQAADRCHRIGQTRGVLIHFVVVEQSLDAYILGAAAKKAESIEKVLDRVSG